MNQEREIAKQLFGEVVKIKATGDHKIDSAEISRPFEKGDCVIHKFCRGCGTTTGIKNLLADDLAKQAGIKLPESLGGCYFEVSGCESCDGIQSKPELKRIQSN
jgi:hypothetical protein